MQMENFVLVHAFLGWIYCDSLIKCVMYVETFVVDKLFGIGVLVILGTLRCPALLWMKFMKKGL